MPEQLVLTPGGYRPGSAVHLVEPDQLIDESDGLLRKLQLGSGDLVVEEYPPVARIDSGTPLMPGEVAVPRDISPATANGWAVYADWTNSTGHPVTSFSTRWVVPPAPKTQSGQTIFLFNGIQNSTMIYQPVLQWGPSAAGGGNYWSVASWYADGPSGTSFHSSLVRVNTGDVLTGVMTLTAQSTGPTGPVYSYSCEFQGIADTRLPIRNVEQLTWLIETLEVYGVTACSDYPDTAVTRFDQIAVSTGSVTPSLNWATVNAIVDCGQLATVVSNSASAGIIDVYYRNPFPDWQLLDRNPATVALAADTGALYQLHNTGKIWRYTGTPLTGWQLLDQNPATKQIVASGRNLYQLHNTGKIWRYTGTPLTGWQLLDQNPATVALVADAGALYQLHNTGKIWRYTGTPLTGWQLLDLRCPASSGW